MEGTNNLLIAKRPTVTQSLFMGAATEHYIISKMLLDGLDVYTPVVDDHGVDLLVRLDSGKIIEVQIKSRSCNVAPKQAALFAAISHEPHANYYFVFYSQILDSIWLMSSEDFVREASQNKGGKNKGKYTINLAGMEKGEAIASQRFEKYRIKDFALFKEMNDASLFTQRILY